MDSILVRLGIAGVGTFASAGDFGSTCDGQRFAGVAWPASSPYLTAVGGTRLVSTAPISASTRSSGTICLDIRPPGRRRGAVGYSAASARPPYQRASGPPGGPRTDPDIAANASNFPGWPVVLAGHWEVDGGTSASAPLVAARVGDPERGPTRRRRPPLGPVIGLFYYLAPGRAETIWDIVSGDNGYSAPFGLTAGQAPAMTWPAGSACPNSRPWRPRSPDPVVAEPSHERGQTRSIRLQVFGGCRTRCPGRRSRAPR